MKDRTGADFIVRFCPIHISTFIDSKSTNCAWDKAMGPRPGRGVCESYQSTVILGYGVRVYEFREDAE